MLGNRSFGRKPTRAVRDFWIPIKKYWAERTDANAEPPPLGREPSDPGHERDDGNGAKLHDRPDWILQPVRPIVEEAAVIPTEKSSS